MKSIDQMTDERVLDLLKEVLETEVGKSANNFDWQEYWDMTDQEFHRLQISLNDLTLKRNHQLTYEEDQS